MICLSNGRYGAVGDRQTVYFSVFIGPMMPELFPPSVFIPIDFATLNGVSRSRSGSVLTLGSGTFDVVFPFVWSFERLFWLSFLKIPQPTQHSALVACLVVVSVLKYTFLFVVENM